MGPCFSSQKKCSKESSGWKSNIGDSLILNPAVGEHSVARERLHAESKRDSLLNLIATRHVASSRRAVSCLHTQQGQKGPNQDTMLVWEEYLSQPDTTLVGVFDGHGVYGHVVAKRVRDSLASHVSATWQKVLSSDDLSLQGNGVIKSPTGAKNIKLSPLAGDQGNQSARSKWKGEEALEKWRSILGEAFEEMEKEVRVHPRFDPWSSGAAAVLVIKQGRDLVVAHVGDSRAVLASSGEEEGKLVASQLTEDHKCGIPGESKRIRDANGRIFSLDDEPDVLRAWLPNDLSPGLAMSRAFGDVVLKDHGLSAVPDILHRRISSTDKFIILATDGLWDVMSNQEAVHIATSAGVHAAEKLVEVACKKWAQNFPKSKRDDCTAVVLFFHIYDSDSEELTVTEVRAEEAPKSVLEEEEERNFGSAPSRDASIPPRLSVYQRTDSNSTAGDSEEDESVNLKDMVHGREGESSSRDCSHHGNDTTGEREIR